MTPPSVTVCIPCASYHEGIVQRAIDSVENQTVSAHCLWTVDKDGQGPGVVRNRLLAHVETPYIVFLDADDWLDPHFVEECLRVIKPGRYVYTDWYNPDNYRHAPDQPYCYRDYMTKTWHVITALLPTETVRNMGGFNESLPALEDTDFYLRLTRRHSTCGIHIRKALMYYGAEGQRAQKAKDDGYERQLLDTLLAQYKGDPMPCCGQTAEIDPNIPLGQRQANDVLAQAQWRGNRKEYGRATRRFYPRMSWPASTWVDKRDVEMSPNLWQEMVEPAVDNGRTGNLDVFTQVFHNPPPPQATPQQPAEPQAVGVPTDPPDFHPSIERVVTIAQERL